MSRYIDGVLVEDWEIEEYMLMQPAMKMNIHADSDIDLQEIIEAGRQFYAQVGNGDEQADSNTNSHVK